MQFQFSFKQMAPSEALKTHTQAKLMERIQKFVSKPVAIHVTFSQERHEFVMHCGITGGDGFNIEAETKCDDAYKAVDLVSDKLTTQLKRQKEQLKEHKGKTPTAQVARPKFRKDKGEINIDAAEIDAADILKYEALRKQRKQG